MGQVNAKNERAKPLQPGAEFCGPPRLVTFDRMVEFERVVWDRGQNSHSDEQAAKRDGLTRPIASGQNQMAFIHELLEATFGDGWVYGGSISVRYIHPVYAGDQIMARARVLSVSESDGTSRVQLEVWCHNQDDQKTAAGKASAGQPTGTLSWMEPTS
jgi:acyl dehydratase